MSFLNRWFLMIAAVLLAAGCASVALRDPTGPAEGAAPAAGADGADYVSQALPATYEGALPASVQMELGILKLEGTELSVTPAQARALLPLWQALQGAGLADQAERNAVLKQIENTMSAEQVQTIAGMQLTGATLRAWMEESGLRPPQGAPAPGGTPPAGAPGGAPFENMTDAEREAFRATRQASRQNGGGSGQFEGRAPRGTPGANGFRRAGEAGGFGQSQFLIAPVVELLAARAAQ